MHVHLKSIGSEIGEFYRKLFQQLCYDLCDYKKLYAHQTDARINSIN